MKEIVRWRINGHRWQAQFSHPSSLERVAEPSPSWNAGSREVHISSPSTSLPSRKEAHQAGMNGANSICGRQHNVADWLETLHHRQTLPTTLTLAHCPPSTFSSSINQPQHSSYTVYLWEANINGNTVDDARHTPVERDYCPFDQECSTTSGKRHDDLSVLAPSPTCVRSTKRSQQWLG